MSAPMTQDEMVRAMVAQGVPRLRAEYFADQHAKGLAPEWLSGQATAHFAEGARVEIGGASVDYLAVGPELRFPIRITLPWSALCSDNVREKASLIYVKGKPTPRKLMTAMYRLARAKVVAHARAAMTVEGTVFLPLTMPVALVARVYVPDERIHDVCNFSKGVHDAIQHIVIVNDSQLYDTRWVRAGVDVDRPRAELEITAL